MHKYRRQALTFLIGYLILFTLVFLLSLFNLNRGYAMFSIGLSAQTENMILIVLSLLAMVKVVAEIVRTESHEEFERRIRSSAP